jgi:magnesium chelatase family protein
LTLTGTVRETPGAIVKLSAITDPANARILIPLANRREADLLGLSASYVCCLKNAVQVLTDSQDQACTCCEALNSDRRALRDRVGEGNNAEEDYTARMTPVCSDSERDIALDSALDFSLLKGQEKASRAIILAAAGMHNLLLSGSPGSGKTTAARVLRNILPPLTREEKIDYLRTVSASRVLEDREILSDFRPFRYVHHSCTTGRLIGNPAGNIPGELALSVNGILFLDEMAEFSPRVLDMLRQPLENKCENRLATNNSPAFPSRFLLVGAMNPCRCGRLLDSPSTCSCTVAQRRQYDKRISGPILDRIDIFCELYRLRHQALFDSVAQGSALQSEYIRQDIKNCWEIQFKRCKEYGMSPLLNGEADGFQINELFRIRKEVLENAVLSAERLCISARGLSKILRVARTIADLEGEADMKIHHVSEAFQFRNRREVSVSAIPMFRDMSKYKGGINR